MFIETQMRTALLKTLPKANLRVKDTAIKIADTADRGAGVHRVRDWNAHLSMRTYQSLQRQGIMA